MSVVPPPDQRATHGHATGHDPMKTPPSGPQTHPGETAFAEKQRRHRETLHTRMQHDASAVLAGVFHDGPGVGEQMAALFTAIACRTRRALHADRSTVVSRGATGEWILYHAEIPCLTCSSRRCATAPMTNEPAEPTENTSVQVIPASADPVDVMRIPGATSRLCAFMRAADGTPLGLLSVQSASQRTFSGTDMALLSAVAEIVAAHLPAMFDAPPEPPPVRRTRTLPQTACPPHDA